MRSIAGLVLALVMVVLLGSPAMARVAAIQTTAALRDHSEESITEALQKAFDDALRGAAAMGLPQVQIDDAVILPERNSVAVRILAADSEGELDAEEESGGQEEVVAPQPGGEAGERPGQTAHLTL